MLAITRFLRRNRGIFSFTDTLVALVVFSLLATALTTAFLRMHTTNAAYLTAQSSVTRVTLLSTTLRRDLAAATAVQVADGGTSLKLTLEGITHQYTLTTDQLYYDQLVQGAASVTTNPPFQLSDGVLRIDFTYEGQPLLLTQLL